MILPGMNAPRRRGGEAKSFGKPARHRSTIKVGGVTGRQRRVSRARSPMNGFRTTATTIGRCRKAIRASRRSLYFGGSLLAVLWGATLPAAAHEIRMALVATESAGPEADARRGFLLAVDQSPDVSHPPGPDAGDHLGGVDVEIVTIDADDGDAAPDRVRAVIEGGASAVVIVAPNPILTAVSAAADRRGKLIVAVAEDGAAAPPGVEIVLRALPAERLDRARLERFEAEFANAYGRPPTSTAALGYDAGRLLDQLIGEIGEDLRVDGPLDAAVRNAAGVLAATRLEVPDPEAVTDSRAATREPRSADARRRAVQLFAASVILLLLAVAAASRRRRGG